MSPGRLTNYDQADFLDNEEDVQAYLQACAEEGDERLISGSFEAADRARARWVAP